jgi:hypothetical protein
MTPEESSQRAPDARTGPPTANSPEEFEESYSFFDYLESDKGHELAGRAISLLEGIKKATIENSAELQKRDFEYQHKIQKLWLCLQSAVFLVSIVVAAVLAWHGKLDATVAALMGTLFGYFLGRPLR